MGCFIVSCSARVYADSRESVAHASSSCVLICCGLSVCLFLFIQANELVSLPVLSGVDRTIRIRQITLSQRRKAQHQQQHPLHQQQQLREQQQRKQQQQKQRYLQQRLQRKQEQGLRRLKQLSPSAYQQQEEAQQGLMSAPLARLMHNQQQQQQQNHSSATEMPEQQPAHQQSQSSTASDEEVEQALTHLLFSAGEASGSMVSVCLCVLQCEQKNAHPMRCQHF